MHVERTRPQGQAVESENVCAGADQEVKPLLEKTRALYINLEGGLTTHAAARVDRCPRRGVLAPDPRLRGAPAAHRRCAAQLDELPDEEDPEDEEADAEVGGRVEEDGRVEVVVVVGQQCLQRSWYADVGGSCEPYVSYLA